MPHRTKALRNRYQRKRRKGAAGDKIRAYHREYGHAYYRKHLEKMRAYQREWRREWRSKHPRKSRAYHRQYSRKWRAEHREYWRLKMREASRRYRERHRAILRERAKRYYRKEKRFKPAQRLARKRRYWLKNRGRINARTREKRRFNPGRFRAIDRARYWRNPEKRRMQSRIVRGKRTGSTDTYTGRQFHDLVKQYNHRCAYCGIKLTPANITADHKVPLARGGTNTIENIVPACRPCNQEKNRLTAEEFLQRNKASIT